MTDKNQETDDQQQRPTLIKATFYITPEHDTKLEEYKLKLRRQGEKVDKSELVRRAIDLLVKE